MDCGCGCLYGEGTETLGNGGGLSLGYGRQGTEAEPVARTVLYRDRTETIGGGGGGGGVGGVGLDYGREGGRRQPPAS